MADQAIIKIPVVTEFDAKGLAEAIKGWSTLTSEIRRAIDTQKNFQKGVSGIVDEMKEFQHIEEEVMDNLSSDTRQWVENMKKASAEMEELEKAAKKAEAAAAAATDPTEKAKHTATAADKNKQLKQKADDMKKDHRSSVKHRGMLDRETKLRKRNLQKAQSSANYTIRGLDDERKADGKKLFQQLRAGDMKGAAKSGFGSMGKSFMSKASQSYLNKEGGIMARIGQMGAGEGGLMRMLARIGPSLTMAAGAIAGIVLILKMASDQMVRLNKAMIEGLALGNDMTGNSQDYQDSLAKLRSYAEEASDTLMHYGKNQEDYLKVVNALAQSTSGSVVQAQQDLERSAGGTTTFVDTIMRYGAALGQAPEELAGTIGKWQREYGLANSDLTHSLKSVADAAVGSGVDVKKFFDVFHETTADVSLYNNRMEELASTMKNLARYMSMTNVKKFMEAFKGGYANASAQERLKDTLILGPNWMQEQLGKDFDNKADYYADTLKSMGGESAKDFLAAMNDPKNEEAFKKGMQAVREGLEKGYFNAATAEGASALLSRKKQSQGDVLDISSALRSGSMSTIIAAAMGKVKMFNPQTTDEEFENSIKNGISGINEHILSGLGYSSDQINQLDELARMQGRIQYQLENSGTTGYEDLDRALIGVMKAEKKEITLDAFKKASGAEIRAAMEQSHLFDTKISGTSDMIRKQYEVTTGINDILNQGIMWLLERMLGMLSPLVEGINSLVSWSFDNSTKTQLEEYRLLLSQNTKEAAARRLEESGYASGSAEFKEGMLLNQVFTDLIRGMKEGAGNVKLQAQNIANLYDKDTIVGALQGANFSSDWTTFDSTVQERITDFSSNPGEASIEKLSEILKGIDAEEIVAFVNLFKDKTPKGGFRTAEGKKSDTMVTDWLREDQLSPEQRAARQKAKREAKSSMVGTDYLKYNPGEQAKRLAKLADEPESDRVRAPTVISESAETRSRRARELVAVGAASREAGRDVVTAVDASGRASAAATGDLATAVGKHARAVDKAVASASHVSVASTAPAVDPTTEKSSWYEVIAAAVEEGVSGPLFKHANIMIKSQYEAIAANMSVEDRATMETDPSRNRWYKSALGSHPTGQVGSDLLNALFASGIKYDAADVATMQDGEFKDAVTDLQALQDKISGFIQPWLIYKNMYDMSSAKDGKSLAYMGQTQRKLKFHTGGIVSGYGDQMRTLQGGEGILSRNFMDEIWGQFDMVKNIDRKVMSGSISGGGHYNTTINISGLGLTKEQTESAIAGALYKAHSRQV